MKNRKSIFGIIAFVLIAATLVLVQVPTKQGVDYKVYTYKIPLYIKIIEFIDRDYQYGRIVGGITAGKVTGEEKVLAIFNWCVQNIKQKPEGLPVVDDHPLNIIIRGYGVGDQFEDKFTILCTYAGFEAFYKGYEDPEKGKYYMSFVKIRERWSPFSVYNNANAAIDGRFASVDDMLKNHELASQFAARIPTVETERFVNDLKNTSLQVTSVRTMGQSPLGRISCYIKKLFQ